MLLHRLLINKYLLIVLFTGLGLNGWAQTPKETAAANCNEALKFEDEGDYNTALGLLEQSQKLEPANTTYPYEIAYVWYNQKQYQHVVDKLETLKDKSDSFDRLYQLLGKSYTILNQSDRALAVYEDGLKKFPKSGCLLLERGIILLDDKKYDEALAYFEKGIDVAPGFSLNYYWAAKLYCNSSEPIWGVLYGEIFMNLERNGALNQEISKLLYSTYKSQITFPEAGKSAVSFSKRTITEGRKPDKMPYSLVYEATMGAAVATETAIDLNSLDRIRQNFLKFYNDRGFNKIYPNALFAYQDKITKADCMDAYNYWLLSNGDEAAFKIWRAQNPAKWQDFVKWFDANPLKLNDANKFYRGQY